MEQLQHAGGPPQVVWASLMASQPPLALILVVALSLAGGELDVEWDLGGIALYADPGVGVGGIILSRAPWLHAAVILGATSCPTEVVIESGVDLTLRLDWTTGCLG